MDVFLDKKTSIFLIKSMKTPRKEIARALRYMQDYKIKKESMIMEYKKFNNQYVIRIDKGEEICAKLKEVAQKENIKIVFEYLKSEYENLEKWVSMIQNED